MSRSKLGGSAGSEDKYEQILHKYDWHASRPPRGYVYGIGRGAKAFITTAELTVSTSNNAPHISAEEDKFFSMLDAIEQRKSKHNDRKVTKTNEVNSSTQGASSGNTSRKLSWDELSSIESATVGTTQMQGSNVNNLIPRNARDERVEAAEEYAFSDETHVITAQDVLRGKTTSSQTNLQRILTMGSSTEQSTWITHSRAYREMGMSKKALSTLMEGCAQTGSQGSLIWKELLRYIDANNELARRRVLENAVASCPAAEELWVELLHYAIPQEQLGILQKAVLACPSSELLWVRVLEHVPSSNDQRQLIKRALQHNPALPKLWARLARLETLERGKAIFKAASEHYNSFELSIEAITFIEWSLLHDWDVANKNAELKNLNFVKSDKETDSINIKREEHDDVNVRDNERKEEYNNNKSNNSDKWNSLFNVLQTLHDELDQLVRQASQAYLIVNDMSSRMRWLQTACHVATEEKCVWTCGFMLAYMVLPTSAIITPTTQVNAHLLFDDLVQLLLLHDSINTKTTSSSSISSDIAHERGNEQQQKRIHSHEELCALWAAWVICILTLHKNSTTRNINSDQANSKGLARNDVNDTITDLLCGSNSNYSYSVNTSDANMIVDIIYHCVAYAPKNATAQVSSFLSSSSLSSSTSESELLKLKQYKDDSINNTIVKSEEEESLAQSHPTDLIKTKEYQIKKINILQKESRLENTDGSKGDRHNNTMSLETLTSVLVYTLEHTLLSRNAILRIVISNAFFAREELYLCLHILHKQYRMKVDANNNNTSNEDDIKRYFYLENTHNRILLAIAEARVYAAMHLNESADATLQAASALAIESVNTNVNTSIAKMISVENNRCNDVVWYMLALHRRSLQLDTRDLLQTACAHFPHSPRLWLMRLEAMCHDGHCTSMEKEITVKQETEHSDEDEMSLQSTAIVPSSNTNATSFKPNLSASEIRNVRLMCQEALSESNCRYSVEVWIYVALHIEASLLRNLAAARALLLDATLVCCPNVSSPSLPSIRAMESYVQLGIARAKLERMFGVAGERGNNAVALDIVREVLQKIPKTRQGMFRVDASELLSMQIALEPPASRGRVAATVMKMYKPHDALVFMAIAKLYHVAGHFNKAMEEAIKAVRARRNNNEIHSPILYHLYSNSNIIKDGSVNNVIEAKCTNEERLLLMPFTMRSSLTHLLQNSQNSTSSSNSSINSNGVICGDAVALLWKLARLPEYKSIIGTRKEFGYSTVELEKMSELPEIKVQSWVMSIAFATDKGNNSDNIMQSISNKVSNTIMYGPLWSKVSQEDDPSNVTLLGFRDSVEVMLQKVMKLITL